MADLNAVITGIGVVSPGSIGKDSFWKAQEKGFNAAGKPTTFSSGKISVEAVGEVKDFKPEELLGPKGLRNLDRSALFSIVATKAALEEASLIISEKNTDTVGVCTGTTFTHLSPIVEFDAEVFKEGINFANPAIFPSTVINAASSHVSIRFNIQGLNATISTGYTSGLEALRYSLNALETRRVKTVLSGSVDTLSYPVVFGFSKLGYMAGISGIPLSCPFDKRRNGPVLAEAAVSLCVEDERTAQKRGAKPYARIRSIAGFYDAYKIARIHPRGEGLEKAIVKALDDAGVYAREIDYISSCANSSRDLDRIEVAVLKRVFGATLKKIPVSSIKSMIGETFSAAGSLQLVSAIGAMRRGIIPPTINYKTKDPECDIDCVPNKAQKKTVKLALVTSFGPGGYNNACVLEKA